MLTSSTQRRTLRVLGFSCVRRSSGSDAESGLRGPGFWRGLGRDFLSVHVDRTSKPVVLPPPAPRRL